MNSNKNYSIVELVVRDLPEVLKIWEDTANIEVNPDIDNIQSLQEYLFRNRGLSFIAKEASTGRIIGTLLAGTDGLQGFMRHMVVHEKYRGLGVMKALVTNSAERLKRNYGVTQCWAFVFVNNRLGKAYFAGNAWCRIDEGVFLAMPHGWSVGADALPSVNISAMEVESVEVVLDFWRNFGMLETELLYFNVSRLENYIKHNPGLSIIACDSSDNIIGTLFASTDGQYVHLRQLVVDEKFCDIGLESKLLETMILGHKEYSLWQWQAFVAKTDHLQVQLWHKLGWLTTTDFIAFELNNY